MREIYDMTTSPIMHCGRGELRERSINALHKYNEGVVIYGELHESEVFSTDSS